MEVSRLSGDIQMRKDIFNPDEVLGTYAAQIASLKESL